MSCIALNQLATPGLGSILAGHWLMGAGQLLMAAAGFGLFVAWFFQKMSDMAALTNNTPMPVHGYPWAGKVGVILFVGAWAWSGITSISIYLEADKLS